jgi:RNA polymerase sigma-70 factor (ECF subfamily)
MAGLARLPFERVDPGAPAEGSMTVQALRDRRIETLADVLALHGREIQAVAFLILRDRALAEDVTIETLLTAFERGGQIRDEASLRAWLLRVATNKAISLRRASARVVDLQVLPDQPSAGSMADDATDRLALLAGVAGLPVRMRAAVVLRYYADLPIAEVAAILGKSENTIKAQLQTALDRLRRSLAEPIGAAPEARHA